MSTSIPAAAKLELLRWDRERDEPYFLIPGFPDLRLTPWRKGDDQMATDMYNDPEIGKYSQHRPYPYRLQDTAFIWEQMYPGIKTTIDLLRPLFSSPSLVSNASSDKSPIDPCLSASAPPEEWTTLPTWPCDALRHHPTGTIVADIGFFQDSEGTSEAEAHAAFTNSDAAQASAPPEEQTWEVGYCTVPQWRGRGVTKAAVGVVMDCWATWLGIGRVVAYIEIANPGSARCVERNGFRLTTSYMRDWPEHNGGGQRLIGRWERRLR